MKTGVNKMNKIWILTKEFSGYESCGDIYIAAFVNKPTCKELNNETL